MHQKKKILIIASVFAPEPVVSATLMVDLAEDLSNDYDVTVIRPFPTRPMGFIMPDYDDNDISRPYKVITISSYVSPQSTLLSRFRECISFGKASAKYIKDNNGKFDLIYNAAWPMYGKLYVGRAAKECGVPYISTVQDIYPESIASKLPNVPGFKGLVNALLMPIDIENLRNAALIHTISDKMADELSVTRGIARNKFIVVRNWQDERKFNMPQPINKSKDDLFTFMYLGNVGPLAGIDTLIDAINLITNEKYCFRLVVAGSGSAKNRLIEKTKAIGLHNVEFWDVPSEAVATTQAKADVLILPVMKGFALSSIPSKLPAYMFSARPIIACVDSGSDSARCITESDSGWVIEPENPKALATKMVQVMSESIEALNNKGANGRAYALENLGRKNLAKLAKAFRDVLDK